MQQTPVRSFTELVAWQKARVVRKAIRVLVKDWPPEEKFRLVDQIIRSSRGPCANIAEGFGRFHEKDNARFCRMAKSSLYETMDHLTAAYDEEYLDSRSVKAHWTMIEESIRVINGYVRYLNSHDNSAHASEPLVEYGDVQDIFGPPPSDLTGEDDRDVPPTNN
ncbi:MAG: four helix bundle protein [Flavobacteriales bacterium]|nr:four helix bundle protein [Flavobacteriales bacterium]